jgi:hypothetical protein
MTNSDEARERLKAFARRLLETRDTLPAVLWTIYGPTRRDPRNNLIDDLSTLLAREEALEGALRPFADEFGEGVPRPDSFQVVGNLTLGDFRRAAALLNPDPLPETAEGDA